MRYKQKRITNKLNSKKSIELKTIIQNKDLYKI